MSVIQCYCPTCRRTVYAEDTDSPECPVCLTRVFVAADDTLDQPGPAKSGEVPRGLGAGGKRKDSPTGG